MNVNNSNEFNNTSTPESKKCLASLTNRMKLLRSSHNKKETLKQIKSLLRTEFEPTPIIKQLQSLIVKIYIDS